DAADPLYKTLDEGQKRRLAFLTRMDGRFGGEGWQQHRHHGDDGADRMGRRGGPDQDRDEGSGKL
ncbi:MAG: hypothetical protein J0H25_18045, partial [Rhizobiales bacterium]|nr:hypothetical protein [Hyphomicrobiales bacterium]